MSVHESSSVSKDKSMYESQGPGDKRQREDEKRNTGVYQSRSVSKDKSKMRNTGVYQSRSVSKDKSKKRNTGVYQSRSVSKDKGKMRRETQVCIRVGVCQKTKAR